MDQLPNSFEGKDDANRNGYVTANPIQGDEHKDNKGWP
jgi:hypothetical protein